MMISAVFVLAAALHVNGQQPSPEILGIRLGMPYSTAHARLAKMGSFRSEDEGQQVWILNHDKHYQYVIVGFDRDRKVRYVTVLANPAGEAVNYEDVGNLRNATQSGGPGNLRYTWILANKKEHLEYMVIAKGTDPRRLARWSIKRIERRQDGDNRD
jgi:hypothetical protein